MPRRSNSTRDVLLTSQAITETPVPNVQTISTGSGKVGYILFNDHIATAEGELYDAVQQLATDGISDLVLDLRYNGGGYLDIASELAYMIAGPANTNGKAFETLQFNDQHPSTNPVTGDPLTPVPFHSTTQGFSVASGQALPTLSLSRVFVLTGNDTCSASESIINSLRGIDVNVIQIGSTTCGKPYGFARRDNCGYAYFPIEFQGVNAQGFGDYAAGFTPTCAAADDFEHALGSTAERLLATALYHVDKGTCPAQPLAAPLGIPSSQPPGHPLLRGKLLPSQ